MKNGYDITVTDGEIVIRVEENTSCRCMSCGDFFINFNDNDKEDPCKECLECYVYGENKERNILNKTIHFLALRVAELENKLKDIKYET